MASSRRGSDEALGVTIAVIAVVIYLGALGTGFSGDDYFILARLKHLNGLADPLAYFTFGFFDYYRPIAFLSHALDWQIWGPRPIGFHLTNVVLHAANSVLVFLIGRRLTDSGGAYVAALLFAVHPASQEAVYWMAARFDLLATCFSLIAVLLLRHDGRILRSVGVAAFALALLSKESALSVLLIAPAYDVLIGRRDWRAAVSRLVPLLGVGAAYALLRSQSASLAAAGGAGKLPKLLMLAAGIAAVIWLARRRAAAPSAPASASPIETPPRAFPLPRTSLLVATAAALLLLALARGPTSAWMQRTAGFAAYATFYLLSPIVFPSPPLAVFEPPSLVYALFGVAAVLLMLWTLRSGVAWLERVPAGAFLAVFVIAALLPVSSMTGGMRYLYLASAGVSLLIGVAARTWSPRARSRGVLVLTIVLLVSWAQIEQAGKNWRWASTMTANGLATMSAELEPCRQKEIILLTAPVGLRGTYCNFYWDAFDATTDCPPASFLTVLRVVRHDAEVQIRDRGNGVFDLRVPRYANQFVASRDLRNFDVSVAAGDRKTIETPVGTLETWPQGPSPDGPAQIFTLTLSPQAQQASLFYYGTGRVHRLR